MKRWLFVLTSVALAASRLGAQSPTAPPIRAFAPCPWGSADCNVCVADVVGAVSRLRTRGDAMGFHMRGAPDVTLVDHWEGVQRLMGDGGRFLAVSRALSEESQDVSFAIVRMASRNDDGLRFRSNRLNRSRDIPFTPPPNGDRIVTTMPHEAGFTHAGGMQALGHVLAVPFERSGTLVRAGASKVVFYDVREPLNPVRLTNDVDHTDLSDEAGTATLGKLANGHFLLAIGRGGANTLDFYVSDTNDLKTTGYQWFDTWHEGELTGGDSEFGDYQSLNFVAQCDGSLFMIGTHRNLGATLGRDFIDVFHLSNATGNRVAIRKVANKHVVCDGNCNLDAAGGAYVDPNGRLYVYGATHDNDGAVFDDPGPCSGAHCSTEFAEFRPIPHGTCRVIEDAWAELHDDVRFGDRSLMIDYRDRLREDYSNFDRAEGFEDKTSSARWCIPRGAALRLWEHKNPCGGDHLDLVGNGTLRAAASLGGFGDETSCAEWRGGPFARAGVDRTAECTGSTTSVPLDGRASIFLEDGAKTFQWQGPGVIFDESTASTPIGRFPLAHTPVTLTVSQSGGSNTDTVAVNVVDTVAPTIACPANIVVDATMPAGALVRYPGPAATDSCSVRSVVCAAPSGSSFPIGSNIVQCGVADYANHSAACRFTVKVKAPAEQITDLIARIEALPGVRPGTKNSFIAKLESALASLARGHTTPACDKLRALLHEVNAQAGRGLTPAQAAELTAIVTRIRGALACG